ncbi:hypothetical protein [Fibrisoma montanum]|uniref:hypothetical protein n=1 Tax=Fibrisoma montanum TaxID=2305895 RepID=UPI001314A9ED|nr:hypothetical protein [Fibrisoma montanum]
MSDYYFIVLWVTLAVVLAALGGFVIGMVYMDNRRRLDDAYNPKFRPDDYAPRRLSGL